MHLHLLELRGCSTSAGGPGGNWEQGERGYSPD